jgi:hypothetical protein
MAARSDKGFSLGFGMPRWNPLDRVADVVTRHSRVELFTYARYNAELSREGLDHLSLPQIDPTHVQQMDSVDHIGEMQEVGRAVAQQKVRAGHFF